MQKPVHYDLDLYGLCDGRAWDSATILCGYIPGPELEYTWQVQDVTCERCEALLAQIYNKMRNMYAKPA